MPELFRTADLLVKAKPPEGLQIEYEQMGVGRVLDSSLSPVNTYGIYLWKLRRGARADKTGFGHRITVKGRIIEVHTRNVGPDEVKVLEVAESESR